jgi:hypothetical protein
VVSRKIGWLPCRATDWARHPGASPPMRMAASWSGSPIRRIQACGAMIRAHGELPSDGQGRKPFIREDKRALALTIYQFFAERC